MDIKTFSHLALSNNGFLFDSYTGQTYTLNKAATIIFKELINNNEEDVVDKITETFDVTLEIAKRDYQEFLRQISELKLLK